MSPQQLLQEQLILKTKIKRGTERLTIQQLKAAYVRDLIQNLIYGLQTPNMFYPNTRTMVSIQ